MAKFPIPSFNFSVKIEGSDIECSEVTGLKGSVEFHEVRSGTHNNLLFKIPTKVTYGDVTFKKGVIREDNRQLLDKIKAKMDMNSPYGFKTQWDDISIVLKDEGQDNMYQWTMINPSLISWEFSALNAMSNEIAFETLVFNCIEVQTKIF